MNKFVKEQMLKLMVAMNIRSGMLTSEYALQSLLDKLRPISCDKALIRLGSMRDGGYLVPDDLRGIKACFSPGVGCSSTFEKDCADRGMKVFLADGFVDQPRQAHELFVFTKKYIGTQTKDHYITMDDWVKSSWPDAHDDLLLQMDIEGSEYDVLLAASNDLIKRFRIIVIEFHFLNKLRTKSFFEWASRVFEKILQSHTCVHNHPNNFADSIKYRGLEIPKVIELTFLRHDRVSSPSFVRIFPHPLDADNTKKKPSLPLPECWYKGHNI